jgi:hypothetical protein
MVTRGPTEGELSPDIPTSSLGTAAAATLSPTSCPTTGYAIFRTTDSTVRPASTIAAATRNPYLAGILASGAVAPLACIEYLPLDYFGAATAAFATEVPPAACLAIAHSWGWPFSSFGLMQPDSSALWDLRQKLTGLE